MKAIIFDIQRFSLHDGPGIRTTIFFKGCPLQCIWCQNPESHQTKPEIAFYAESCQTCFKCETVCNEGAILHSKTQRVDYSKCTDCGECVTACVHHGLRLIGRTWDPESLLAEILKDKDYFIDSGGGLTLSGGEPMHQAQFLENFLPLVKAHNIHTNIETSGMFNWILMERLLPYLDLIYFDIKHLNSQYHYQYTHQENKIILDNFAQLSKTAINLQARMPIIPDLNNNLENIKATAQFLRRHGHQKIHCLPYHNFGEAKIAHLDTQLKPLHLTALTANDLEIIKKTFKEEGIDATIYD